MRGNGDVTGPDTYFSPLISSKPRKGSLCKQRMIVRGRIHERVRANAGRGDGRVGTRDTRLGVKENGVLVNHGAENTGVSHGPDLGTAFTKGPLSLGLGNPQHPRPISEQRDQRLS